MDKIIPSYYRDYGKYVNLFRALPLSVDGLKPVERRLLLSCYQIARDKFTKSARIDGHCLGHYHPHGSSYGTLVQLVRRGFVDGQGNWGSSAGVEDTPAAAMRYTEARLSKKIQDMCFKYIDYVPWIALELDEEPLYLPSMFPLCLIGNSYTVGIGFGYKTVIPCYEIKDLVTRLRFLLEKREKEAQNQPFSKKPPTIKPITDCDILSSDSVLEALLTSGKAAIKVKGRYSVDRVKMTVSVYSWPHGKRFETILNKILPLLTQKEVGYIDESTDKTKIVFEVIRQRNKAEVLEKLVSTIDSALEGTIQFEIVVVDTNGKVRLMSVDELLIVAYENYKSSVRAYLEDLNTKLDSQISELEAIAALKPFVSQSAAIASQKGVEEAVSYLATMVRSLDAETIKQILNKHRIMKLLTIDVDTEELKQQKAEALSNLLNLDSFVWSHYEQL